MVESSIRAYKSGDYNETQARGDFIDPLMSLLGWDVKQIDRLVYGLYGLTDEEIRVV